MTLIILDSVIRVHFEGIIQQQQQRQRGVTFDERFNVIHATPSHTHRMIKLKNLYSAQSKWQTGFHFIPLKIWIYIFFIAVKSFLPGGASCGDVSRGKKRRHTQTVYTIKNDGNFHGAHCQRKFMVVIHHYIFFSLSFRAIFVENQIMFAALIHLNVCVCVPLS